jgi:two-component system OmpR family sensor kinase
VSIRLRVTLATVLLAALAVGAADVTTFTLLRRYFNHREDVSVRQVAATAVIALRNGQRLTLPTFAGTDRPALVEVLDANGRVLQRVGSSEAADVNLPAGLLSHPGRSQQIDAPNHDGPAFQVIAVPAPGNRTVVAATSLKAEVATLTRLFGLNVTVGAIVLALLALVASVVLTYSFRPLRRIATTADAIVAGDLAARVPEAPRRSEIGRVGTALNRMLGEIEAAFAQRDATEDRLRRFLADASHELRTPLTSIRGYAELFRRGAARRPEDLAQSMRAIEDEAARMSRLVDDLLLLARLDDARPLERVPFALDDLVEQAVDAARVVEPGRPFQFELFERPLVVEGDPGRLRQVLDNLLANVREHTPPGAPAYVSLRTEGGWAVLAVEDSGPGVSAEERELVFDRFFRPDVSRGREFGGAGLGLAIARSIVVAHGGEIAARPARPHGSVFEIRLPIAAGSDSRVTPS